MGRDEAGQLHRILLRPLPRHSNGILLVLLIVLRAFVVERVIWVGGGEESLDGEKDGSDLECGGPFVCGQTTR